ncbi:hypothetical protein QO206_13320 [Leeuwenhoekiella aequorea]|uniref:hypothetical protein n=1 Tax=Leeuwenhoekiella aequorea TaxID=283736 RepID=UPI00352F4C28|tara:strand:+ start:22631 stop:23260 length:630 start_codon:yes stop_codon:yes gene_type:complete
MDNKQLTPIRLYTNCDELPMWNFEQVRKTGDLKWLVYLFDGFGEVEVPEDAPMVWDNILSQYSELTANNETIQYFELLADQSDLQTRLEFGAILLQNVAERWHLMPKYIQEGYVDALKDHRFYLDTRKPLDKELERLFRQLKAVEMKLKQFNGEKEVFEKKRPETDLIEVKVKIQRIIKMSIDLKKVSIKEWLLTITDAINSVKSSKNG